MSIDTNQLLKLIDCHLDHGDTRQTACTLRQCKEVINNQKNEIDLLKKELTLVTNDRNYKKGMITGLKEQIEQMKL